MITARACAKVNLSLRVGRRSGDDGLHGLAGLFVSVDWADDLSIRESDEDAIAGIGSRQVPDGEQNLAWRATVAVRDIAERKPPLSVVLDKSIPVAAGLGGGSADAAAALGATGRLLRVPHDDLAALAPTLGSDVPFCFAGGTARVEGTGERVTRLTPLTGFALAIVVPPVEITAAAVYRRWDHLGGPAADRLRPSSLPPNLRGDELANDLMAAAVDLAPVVSEWRDELAGRWGREVLLSGSGPALFAFFLDMSEAQAALAVIPPGARGAEAVSPVPFGWLVVGNGEAVDSYGRDLEELDDGAWLHLARRNEAL